MQTKPRFSFTFGLIALLIAGWNLSTLPAFAWSASNPPISTSYQDDRFNIGHMDPSSKGLGEPKDYKEFFQARENVTDSPTGSTGPTLTSFAKAGTMTISQHQALQTKLGNALFGIQSANATLAGVDAGSGSTTVNITSQSQNKTPQQNQSKDYQQTGGCDNSGDNFSGSCCNKEYRNYTDTKLSGVYPPGAPPLEIPHSTSPPTMAKMTPSGPFGAGIMGKSALGSFQTGVNHEISGPQALAQASVAAQAGADLGSTAQSKGQQAQAGAAGAAQEGADAMADAFNPTWLQMLVLSKTPLLNVANEATGAACSASQPIKTYENAVYLVQQAYKNLYLPMAILLLLPGAAMTQMKSLVSAGVLQNQNDEDAVSPFTGILRSIIAIFLIPASQLIVSYSIDVGNSLQYEVQRHINYLNIYMWGDEQVFRAPVDKQESQMRPASAFAVLGKLSQGPEGQSGEISQSPATIMLQALVNSTADGAAFGLVILCAFQIALACYLFLMGPVAAALYAWPTGAGSLFVRVFGNWVDAIINLALWRFWWCIVLLCIDTRLGWLGVFEQYTIWEMLMFLSFLIILCYVPFNPFDFKAGEMVSQIMQKADKAVGDATQK